jgi:glycosyltransferase involved in cell wall biosynthesis
MQLSSRHPLVYVLHSSNLYGTERIALDTLSGLSDEFLPILMGPPGPAIEEGERIGCEVHRFRGAKLFAKALRPILREHSRLTFVATGVVQSGICIALNLLYRREINHIQIVHGGGAGSSSYGRKKWLNHVHVTFITVSEWAKDRMIADGVRSDRIQVVPNFLPESRLATIPRRPLYDQPGIRKAIIVSRLDPLKRVEVLLDALDQKSDELRDYSFRIFGLGPEMKSLTERAAKSHPNVEFAGFSGNVPAELTAADILIHTCPVESFGLAVLEAMAANLAVLVPDQGGAGLLVEEGVSGFKFKANDPHHLAERLVEMKSISAESLNAVVVGARRNVDEIYSAKNIMTRYRELFRMK